MSFYQRHIFICTNLRDSGKKCCGQTQANDFADYLKSQLKQRQMHGAGKIRVSRSQCLGRCAKGPVMVIYPEQVWYTFNEQSDIDEIMHNHLLNGERVSRLLLLEQSG